MGDSGQPRILAEASDAGPLRGAHRRPAAAPALAAQAVPYGASHYHGALFIDGAGIMSFTSEFKEFALKGNVMDLAVGVIIGGAFGKIVESIVGDLIMPIVGRIFGGLDFANYFIPLAGQTATTLVEAKKAGAVFAYGNFISVAINFIILAFIIFMMVKQVNRLKRAAPPAPPAPPAPTPEDVLLLREIRDALRK
jgi:large conductance mechanosensitive channel